jgi:hypothetical protein
MTSATKTTNLFIVNQFVDTIQNAKNQFIDTFVWDDKVKAPLKQFVESQREFTKQINRSAFEVADYSLISAKSAFEKIKAVA